MEQSAQSVAFDRAVAPVLGVLLPQREQSLLDVQGDPEIAERIEQLAAKCNEGELTTVEQKEYEGYVYANKFIAVLKRQAARRQSFNER